MDAGSGVMTWWKATRPDGTDFYTGTVDYAAALASGEPTPELSGEGEFPGEGWYHLATVPTECVGMLWPCRLFEVEPVGDQTLDTEHPYKVGCRQVRVVREVDGHIALGPQGADVVALIARARALTGDDVKRLGAAWDAAWDAALARRSGRRLGRRSGRRSERRSGRRSGRRSERRWGRRSGRRLGRRSGACLP